MSLFCSLPANAMNVLERANSWRDVMHDRQAPLIPGVRDRVLQGRELFDYLVKDMDVVYSFVKEAPDHLLSKEAKIAWGKEKTRYCRGKVEKCEFGFRQFLVSGKRHRLDPLLSSSSSTRR